jgi:hypothetical protein
MLGEVRLGYVRLGHVRLCSIRYVRIGQFMSCLFRLCQVVSA